MASPWDARINRAQELIRKYAFASELLRFYIAIAGFQKGLYQEIGAVRSAHQLHGGNGSFRRPLGETVLLPQFPRFLLLISQAAPPPLAEFARHLAGQNSSAWRQILTTYWEKGGRFEPALDEPSTFCARAFLQPFAEARAAGSVLPLSTASRPVCPVCQSMPQVGVLRPEGDGAKRSLVCSLCATEWDYRRIVCASCGEEDEKKLGVYTAKEFDHLRVEACDTCKTYIETVDLTKDGHAVPLVDELAGVPLSLWASQQSYRKIQPNLLGI